MGYGETTIDHLYRALSGLNYKIDNYLGDDSNRLMVISHR